MRLHGVLFFVLLLLVSCVSSQTSVVESAKEAAYAPVINSSDFTTRITNKYFTLSIGKKFTYQAITEDGIERNEVVVTNETKVIMGVETRVYWDRVWLNNELIEDTRDYLAQDKDGNVWYFGEDVDNYASGKLVSHSGSWIAGVDGALPGIWVKQDPVVGETYRQEYYKGHAEDMADVLSLTETVVVPKGTYTNCLKTRDYTPLEPAVVEYKYYCPEVAMFVLEEAGDERVSLISIQEEEKLGDALQKEAELLKTEITEEEAKEIALKEVPGTVTDVAIESKFGKIAYVVEILSDDGVETDVIIDINTGRVLGIEK